MKLTDEQERALIQIQELREDGAKEIRFAGPAGTGKTTLIRQLLADLPGADIEVVTPTNKAAKVLRSKGVPASTLYSVFFTPEDEAEGRKSGGGPGRGSLPAQLPAVELQRGQARLRRHDRAR